MIERWSFLTSNSTLSKETWLSVQQVRSSIKKLESTSEVTKEWHTTYTIIKLNNYDKYQSDNKQDNKPVTNEQQTSNKRVTTTNKINNNNKINNINNNKLSLVKNESEFLQNSFEYINSKKFLDFHINNKTSSILYIINKKTEEKIIQEWCESVEKLKRIDKYSEEQISYIINLTMENDFWKEQIQNIAKFRKKNNEWIPYFVVMINEAKKNQSSLSNKKQPWVITI